MLAAPWYAIWSVCFSLLLANVSQASSPSTQSLEPTHLITVSSCPSRTINYVTHTLPQQCLRTDWSRNTTSAETSIRATIGGISGSTSVTVAQVTEDTFPTSVLSLPVETETATEPPISAESAPSAESSAQASVPSQQEQDDDPLSNEASFVSFEEWKAQMLKKAGQSPENMINSHEIPGQDARRRPAAINQALDSLGDDVEIELEFSGFGSAEEVVPSVPKPRNHEGQQLNEDAGSVPAPPKRSREAGKTSRERFNYASFDCAATVLKTNSECKGSTWILHEHKDSYMLNPCSVNNKFFIVELCNDILIDTIALGNYEFFSSTFRQFRVSISDRYPVKADKWRELGIFEAQNTRGVQAFLVENGLIWGRYLRIEILSHYGAEYYCPVSVLRVHGKTMIDDYRNDMKASRGEDDQDDDSELESEVDTSAALSHEEHLTGSASPNSSAEHLYAEEPASNASQGLSDTVVTATNAMNGTTSFPPNCRGPGSFNDTCPRTNYMSPLVEQTHLMSSSCSVDELFCDMELTEKLSVIGRAATSSKPEPTPAPLPRFQDFDPPRIAATAAPIATIPPTSAAHAVTTSDTRVSGSSNAKHVSEDRYTATTSASVVATPTPKPLPPSNSVSSVPTTEVPKSNRTAASSVPSTNTTINGTAVVSAASTRSSAAAPASSPPTQESFFKSVHKRLQLLEANSTLSLQYIEEQSRLLREAFMKVEKRQLNKTSTFLSNLNETVLSELREFRTQYDQIWQSTILELSSQREQSVREAAGLTAKLAILADEVVWQKRLVYLQFGMILLCFGMFMFSRSPTNGLNQSYIDLPPFRDIWTRSPRPSLRRGRLRSGTETSIRHGLETPISSPSRPSSGHGITWGKLKTSDDESDVETKSLGPTLDYHPPTPPSEESGLKPTIRATADLDRTDSPIPDPILRRVISSPVLGVDAHDSDEDLDDPIETTAVRDEGDEDMQGSMGSSITNATAAS